jgi:hypothetical protein
MSRRSGRILALCLLISFGRGVELAPAQPDQETDNFKTQRRVALCGHTWIIVDDYDDQGNKIGEISLHFSPEGFTMNPTDQDIYPNEFSFYVESTRNADKRLIEMWKYQEEHGGDMPVDLPGFGPWSPGYNCVCVTTQFAKYGIEPGEPVKRPEDTMLVDIDVRAAPDWTPAGQRETARRLNLAWENAKTVGEHIDVLGMFGESIVRDAKDKCLYLLGLEAWPSTPAEPAPQTQLTEQAQPSPQAKQPTTEQAPGPPQNQPVAPLPSSGDGSEKEKRVSSSNDGPGGLGTALDAFVSSQNGPYSAFNLPSVQAAPPGRGVQDVTIEIHTDGGGDGSAAPRGERFVPGGAALSEPIPDAGEVHELGNPLAHEADSPLLYVVAKGGPTGDVFALQIVHPASGPVAIEGLVTVEPVAATPADRERFERELASSGRAQETLTAAGYCLQMDALAPPAGTVYRVAPAERQSHYALMRRALDAARRLREAGQLHPDSDPTDYYHSIRQWAVWTIEKGLDREGFLDAFVARTEKNFREAGQPWSAEVAAAVRSYGEGRWSDIREILDAAEAAPD